MESFKIIFAFIFIVFFIGCGSDQSSIAEANQMKFDKSLWQAKKGDGYPFREAMLENVIWNDSLRALDESALKAALGEPQRETEAHLYYLINQQKMGVFPLHTKMLVIKLTPEDKVEWMKIHE